MRMDNLESDDVEDGLFLKSIISIDVGATKHANKPSLSLPATDEDSVSHLRYRHRGMQTLGETGER